MQKWRRRKRNPVSARSELSRKTFEDAAAVTEQNFIIPEACDSDSEGTSNSNLIGESHQMVNDVTFHCFLYVFKQAISLCLNNITPLCVFALLPYNISRTFLFVFQEYCHPLLNIGQFRFHFSVAIIGLIHVSFVTLSSFVIMNL